MLDFKKRYGVVQGDSVARYYQNGKNYDGSGNELTAEEAGAPADVGAKMVEARLGEALLQGNAAADAAAKDLADRVEAARIAAEAQARADASLTAEEVKALLDECSDVESAALVVSKLKNKQLVEFIEEVLGIDPSPARGKAGMEQNYQIILGAWQIANEPEDSDPSGDPGDEADLSGDE